MAAASLLAEDDVAEMALAPPPSSAVAAAPAAAAAAAPASAASTPSTAAARNPWTKLDLAWAAVATPSAASAPGESDKVALRFGELETLLEVLVSAGHVDARCLVKQTSRWPVRFAPRSTRELAELFFYDLGLQPQRDTMTLAQFKRAARSLTKAREFTLWYLQPRKGSLGLWKDEKLERLRRWLDGPSRL
jgi:hypothetical protein